MQARLTFALSTEYSKKRPTLKAKPLQYNCLPLSHKSQLLEKRKERLGVAMITINKIVPKGYGKDG